MTPVISFHGDPGRKPVGGITDKGHSLADSSEQRVIFEAVNLCSQAALKLINYCSVMQGSREEEKNHIQQPPDKQGKLQTVQYEKKVVKCSGN